jgi:protein ImuB
MNVACLLIPRFGLRAACVERQGLLSELIALAPEPGGELAIGEVSGACEANGVQAGMRLGEALARCPELVLVQPDTGRAVELWEELLRRLEEIGAAVESERPGGAFFAIDGLGGIHGGTAGVLQAARGAVEVPARIAVAPTRFAAFLGASLRQPSPRSATQPEIVIAASELREFLAPLPISTLLTRLGPPRREVRELVASLRQLGIDRLGALAALSSNQIADRFGRLGLRALRLACGEDDPPCPRRPQVELAEGIDLPEATAGEQLEHALELLIDRLLAAPERRGRTVLAFRLGATLCAGGSWSATQTLSKPSASAKTLCRVLSPRLTALPGPASSLSLQVTSLGPQDSEQLELSRRGEELRRGSLIEAVRQIRAVAGAEGVLKVLEVDSASRVPERWVMLTPFPGS